MNTSSDDLARKKLKTLKTGTGCGFIAACVAAVGVLAALLPALSVARSGLNWAIYLPFAIPVVALLAGLGLLLPRLLRARRGLQELDQGQTQQISGQVAWTGKGYAMTAGDLKLDPLHGSEFMPGQYMFSYLPQSRFVTQAVRVDTGVADARAQVGDALAAVFKFDADDLAACRTGQLTEAHRARQVRSAVGGFTFMAIFCGLFVVGGLILLFTSAFGTRPQLGGMVGGLLMSVVGGFLIYSTIGSLRAAQAGKVNMIEGVVTERITSSRNSTSYYYVINGKQYTVTRDAQTALVQGQAYRVYVLNNTTTIVAIEPIPST